MQLLCAKIGMQRMVAGGATFVSEPGTIPLMVKIYAPAKEVNSESAFGFYKTNT